MLTELQKLWASQAKEEVGLLWNFKDDLEQMAKTLSMLEAVLHDAESRPNQDESVRLWLAELRDACYDIQDMMDHYMLQYTNQNGQLGCIVSVKVCFGNVYSRVVLAHKMKSMRARLNNIASLKNNFALKEHTVFNMSIMDKNRETISVSEGKVLGRDEERSYIVNLIIDNQASEDVFVIPIYGMGGLGKTTLAQFIYKDNRLREHFDVWAWAYVSIDFNLCNIGSRIISALRKTEFSSDSLENIHQELKKEITGKRCLIVLDDVWTVNMDHWEKLKTILMDSMDSSRRISIVVTTRIEKTAKEIASGDAYRLNNLSNDNCILLFQQKAFKSDEEMNKCPLLVEIGKRIANKCGGVALVANALGSMLRSQRDTKLWSHVENSEIWALDSSSLPQLSSSTQNSQSQWKDKILSGLQLSYNIMPAALKPCFAYCSMYPKGHRIDSFKLTQQWISLNFIRSDPSLHRNFTLHDIAQDHLNNLISLSFLQRSESTNDFGKKFVVMHDLMHDLARHVAKDHDIRIVVGKKENVRDESKTSYRYISIYGLEEESELDEIVQLDGKVRAIYIYSDKVKVKDRSLSLARNLRILEAEGRVINLPKKLKQLHYLSAPRIPTAISLPNPHFLHIFRISSTSLPESIGNFHRLQYLDLSESGYLDTLPKSFGNLTSLQHINLSWCRNLKALPDSIVNLQKLLHLELNSCLQLERLPEHFGNLTRLQYLGLQFCFRLEKLPESLFKLKNLERLVICGADEDEDLPGLLLQLTSLRHISASKPLSTSSIRVMRRLTKFETLDLNIDFTIKEEEEEDAEEEGEEGKKHKCCNIVCLEKLNMLHGELTLRGLEKVKDPKDAERASLKQKNGVLRLELNWKNNDGDDDDDDDATAAAVLQNLHPSAESKSLKIDGYGGRQWPTWTMYHRIEDLRLANIKQDKLIHQLGPMPFLCRLKLCQIPCLKRIEFGNSQVALFPRLKYLCISQMENLEQVLLMNLDPKGDEETITRLKIKECPCLTRISLPPSITDIELVGNVGLVVSSTVTIQAAASSLDQLEIVGCEQLVSLPEWIGGLSSLQSLVVRDCYNIQSLPDCMLQLTELRYLTISGCSLAFKQECENRNSQIWSRIQDIIYKDITAKDGESD